MQLLDASGSECNSTPALATSSTRTNKLFTNDAQQGHSQFGGGGAGNAAFHLRRTRVCVCGAGRRVSGCVDAC